MDLDELKKKYRTAQKPFTVVLLLVTLSLMIWAIINYSLEENELNEMLTGVISFVFFASFFYWVIEFALRYERNRQEMTLFVYDYLLKIHNVKTNRYYTIKPVKENTVKVNGLPIYKNRTIAISLNISDSSSLNKLYYVSIGSGKSFIGAGLLFAYPIQSLKNPIDLINRLQSQYPKAKFQTTQHDDHHFIYYPLKGSMGTPHIPIFNKFTDREQTRVVNFADEVFRFFDQLNNMFLYR